MKTVYLAGHIGKLSYNDATDWRTEVAMAFNKPEPTDSFSMRRYIKCLDPMRHKEFLENETLLAVEADVYDHPLATSKGILMRDFNDVKVANLIFVNLLTSKSPSIGTTLELAWAHVLQKPVVIVAAKDDLHTNHPMIAAMNFVVVDSLALGIEISRSILG